MLIVVSLLAGHTPDQAFLLRQVLGGVAILALAAWVVTRPRIQLPFADLLRRDREIQIFAALLACFGLAFLTGMVGLSAALGAFVAGLVVASARETEWVQDALEPLRIVFVALLFVSMGMLIDVQFVRQHIFLLLALLLGVLFTNTFINAGILRVLGDDWRGSLYAGALLSQIGEFSFVLASVGSQAGLISDFGYQATIALIALSLLVSPLWIQLSKLLLAPRQGRGS